METITAYEDLARLVTGHFHRGVRTNTMVSPEEYGPAIAAGTLRAQATPAGLLLLRDRGTTPASPFIWGPDRSPGRGAAPVPPSPKWLSAPGHRTSGDRLYLTAQGFVPLCWSGLSLPPRGETGEPALPFLPRRRRRSPLCRPFAVCGAQDQSSCLLQRCHRLWVGGFSWGGLNDLSGPQRGEKGDHA